MGQINIQGLGSIQIEGATPTDLEKREIEKFVKENPQALNSDQYLEGETDKLIKGPSWGRLALEIGGSIVGSVMTGGLGLPLMAARMAMLTRPFLTALAKSSAGSGAGAFTGSLTSETFDPTDHAFKTAMRAGAYATAGEAVLAGPSIKAFNFLGSVFKPALKAQTALDSGELSLVRQAANQNRTEAIKQFGKEKVETAEQGLVLGEKMLLNRIEEIRKAAGENFEGAVGTYGSDLVDAAQKAEISLGIKYDNKFIDILENISERSLLGGAPLDKAKKGLREVGDSLINEYNERLMIQAGRASVDPGKFKVGDDVGDAFINSLVGDNQAFKAMIDGRYKGISKSYQEYIDTNRARLLASDLDDPKFMQGGKFNEQLIDTKPMLKSLEAFRKQSRFLLGNATDAESNLLRNINILENNPRMNLEEFIDFKQGINNTFPPITTANKLAYEKVGFALREGTRQIIDADKNLPAELIKNLKGTDDLFSKGTQFFNDDLIKVVAKDLRVTDQGLLVGNGADVVNKILNAKHPSVIGKLLDTVDDGIKKGYLKESVKTNLQTGLKSKLFNDLIENSRQLKGTFGDALDPNKMLATFEKQATAFNRVFDPTEMRQITDNLDALKLAYGKIADEGSLPGGVAITLAQPGALAGLFFGGGSIVTGGAALLLGGPYAVAKLFTNRKVSKYLQTSFKDFQEEAVASYKAAGEGNFAGISNFRKTATTLRQLSDKLVAEKIITQQQKEAFDQSIPDSIRQIQQNIRIEKENAQTTEPKPSVEPVVPRRRPDPIDEAIDNILEPMSSAPAPTPQPQGQAPQAQGSGIASLGNQSSGNQPDQLARMEQVGLPLFRG